MTRSQKEKPKTTVGASTGSTSSTTRTNTTVKSLRKDLKDIGLSSKGNKSELMQRLHEHKALNNTATSPEGTDDSPNGVAIVAERIEPTTDSNTILRAKSALTDTVEREQFTVEWRDSITIVGNEMGVDYGHSKAAISQLEENVRTLTARADASDRRADALGQEAAHTRLYLDTMLTDARRTRERFACVFKRDKLRTANDADLQVIREGNNSVHGGNCVLDGDLWIPNGQRRDIETFQALYGILPQDTHWAAQYQPSLDSLNIHASIVSSQFRKPTNEFITAFKEYADVLQTSDFPSGYLEGDGNAVSLRYWRFHQAANAVPLISDA